MKTISSVVTFLLLSLISFSQAGSYSISGKVLEGVGQSPMQAASVFAQNTMIGTATDVNGNFSLRLPDGGYDLVITFTGYETVSRRISTADADDKNIVIVIKKKENYLIIYLKYF